MLNPVLVREIEGRLASMGKVKRNGEIAIPSWRPHKHDKPGEHATYYPQSQSAYEHSAHETYLMKDLCAWLGIDPADFGGLHADTNQPYTLPQHPTYELPPRKPFRYARDCGFVARCRDNLLYHNHDVRQWLRGRGIIEDAMLAFHLGYYEYPAGENYPAGRWITIPIWGSGDEMTVIHRRNHPLNPVPENPKYKMMSSDYADDVAFDYYPVLRNNPFHVFIVESQLDAIAISCAFESRCAIGMPFSPLMDNPALLLPFEEITVIKDNDENEAGTAIANSLQCLANRIQIMSPPDGFKDIGEMFGYDDEETVLWLRDISGHFGTGESIESLGQELGAVVYVESE